MKKEFLLSLSVIGVITISTAVIGFRSASNANKVSTDISSYNYEQQENNLTMAMNTTETEKEFKVVNERLLETAPDPLVADKADVYHIVLHTIDYFDKASGRLFACTTQDGIARMTDFNTCMSEPYAFCDRKTFKTDDISLISEEYFSKCECLQTIRQYYTRDSFYEVNDLDRTFIEQHGICMNTFDELYPPDKKEFYNIPDSERFSLDENGETHAALMPDPTNIIDSSVFLFPQNYAMGFLSDFELWHINGISEFDGRDCYEISGTTTPKYGTKLGVNQFLMCIDCKTGVILKYEGYNASGQLMNYLYTENIRYDEDVPNAPTFNSDSVNGYKQLK